MKDQYSAQMDAEVEALKNAVIDAGGDPASVDDAFSNQITGLFDENGNVITPPGWQDEASQHDSYDEEQLDLLTADLNGTDLDDEFEEVPDAASDDALTAADGSEASENNDAPDPEMESDEIFEDLPARIPDPDAGEISHGDFVAKGYSMADLLQQQANALTQMSQEEVQDQVHEAMVRNQASQAAYDQSPAQDYARPGVAGTVGYMLGATVAALGAIAVSGGSAIARQVGEFSHGRAKAELATSLDDASGRLATLNGKASTALQGVTNEQERQKILDDFFAEPDQTLELSELTETFRRAETAAAKVIKRGAKLGIDPEQTMADSVGVLADFKQQHKDSLDSIRYDGRSLSERLEDSVKSLFESAKQMFAALLGRFGRGSSSSAESSPAPRMG